MASAGGAVGLDRAIKELEKLIGRHWKELARALKFSQTDIDAIEYRDRDDLWEQIRQFFNRWKMREGNDATVTKLTDALAAAGLRSILDDLKRVLSDETTEETIPVQETNVPISETSPSSSQTSEFVRQKRLERFASSGSDKNVPGAVLPERHVSRSVSTASNSSATLVDHEQTSPSVTPLSPQVKVPLENPPGPQEEAPREEFEVGDTVKVRRRPWYGVIRWIGEIPKVSKLTAGLEMEEKVPAGHSGKFNDVQYFECEEGYGLFLPVSHLQRDDRFDDPPSLIRAPTLEGDEAEKDKEKSSTLSPQSVESSPQKGDMNVLASQSVASPPSSGLTTLAFKCPGDQTGFIIGKDGKNVREVESETNTNIKVHRNQYDQGANATVVIMGAEDNCKKALFKLVLHVKKKIAMHTAATETITIPNRKLCGRVIGRGGSTRRAIENVSGARIKIEDKKGLDALLDPEGPRECIISGSAEQIDIAKELIEMAQQGTDVALTAQIAAHAIKLMKELGFTFPEDIV